MPLVIGQFLHHNRYRVDGLLGQGGMGAVYRGWDTSLGVPVAIKENLAMTPEAKKQFEREAWVLARLSHPNLPRVTDHFFVQGQGQYLVMDYVEGEDLQSMLNRLATLPEPQVLDWAAQICDALAYLHRQPTPIIHRDIKPANIKIRPDGRAVLVDFGIAKLYDAHMATTIGAQAVTPGYSPPEQYGGGSTDVRSDIYALGATLYHLLTGKKPAESVQRMIQASMMPEPRQINRQISPVVSSAIRKATEVATDRRFQNIEAFQRALSSTTPPPITPSPVFATPPPAAVTPPPHVAQRRTPPPQAAARRTPSPQAVPARVATPRPATRPRGKRSSCLLPVILGLGVLLVGGVVIVALALLDGGGGPTPEPWVDNPGVVTLVVKPDDQATAEAAATESARDGGPTVTLVSKDELPPTEIPALVRPTDEPVGGYSHDFESDDGYWPLGGETAELGTYESSLVDGKYRLTYSALGNSVVRRCLSQHVFDDFSLSVDATPVEGPVPYAYGVIFRKQEGTSQFYELRVNNKSEYRVNIKDADWEPLIDWSTSAAILPEGPNHLEVEAIGGRLRFSANGQFLMTAIDTTWSSGEVCFFVWVSEGDTGIVDFDNLVITPERQQ